MTDRCRKQVSFGYPPSRMVWLRGRQRTKASSPLGFRGTYGRKGSTSPKVVMIMSRIGQVVRNRPASASGRLTNGRPTEAHIGQSCESPAVKFTTLDDNSGWGMGQKSLARSVGRTGFASCSYLIKSIRRNSEIHQRGLLVRAWLSGCS